jgi:polar amino acid transport system substrate-binding protein
MDTLVDRKSKGILAAIVCCLPLFVHAQCTKAIVAADPSYPPLHWFDGQTMQGASIAIIKRVLDDLKIAYEVRTVGPLTRVLAAAERGDIDIVVTLKKTPEREGFLLYPKTPALDNPIAVFTARERPIKFGGRGDLIGLNGGITRGNVFGDGFDEYLEKNLTVEAADSPESNFGKLALGRIDYFITGYYAGMAYLLKRGDDSHFKVEIPFLVNTPNYVTLTRKGHCAGQLEAIDARLAQLKKSGVLADLARQSFITWKAQPTVVSN